MWSIIKKAVNSDLSTPLNIPINAIKAKTDLITQIKSKTDLIMGKCQLFLANGTFVVPTGVYAVYLTGCAAGNSGATGIAGTPTGKGGAGGAGGEVIFDFLIPNLTPGQSINVITGPGNTVFGSYLTLTKGGGAAGGAGGGSYDVAGNAGEKGGGSLIKGTPYNGGAGGAGGAGRPYGAGGGGGGGGFSGIGGTGGAGATEAYGAASAGAIGTGYGSGGGGGGARSSGVPGGAGGAGRPGFLFVRWL